MLRLLQQRTKLSGQIGGIKRRSGAVIYVPERERQLLARLTAARKGQPSARAVAAIYREILSSSRAAQGQMPIGYLQDDAEVILPVARCSFGACDQFLEQSSFKALATSLSVGEISLALLSGADLGRILPDRRWRLFPGVTVVGELTQSGKVETPLERRIFVVTPSGSTPLPGADQALILIECKSTQNAIKSLLNSMPDLTIHAQHLNLRASPRGLRSAGALVHLSVSLAPAGASLFGRFEAAAAQVGVAISVLGIYPRIEDYAG